MILFGVLFAVFADPHRQSSVLFDPCLWHGLVFATIFNVAVFYAIKHYPDWMWMYYLEDSKNTVSEYIFLFGFLYYFQVIFGYYLGRDVKRVSLIFWILLVLLLLAVEAWLVWHLFDRYSVIGSREEFISGHAVNLFGPDNPIKNVMNGSVIGMAVYFLFVVVWNRKRKRRMFKR